MNTRTQRGEIVQAGREVVSGPATRWMAPVEQNIAFPIERLAGGDVGTVGGHLVTVDPALYNGTGGSEEYATPVSRAKGQVIRLAPFAIVWLVLSIGIVWLLGLTWPYLLLAFSVLTAATFIRLNGQEFEHSRNGVERHRIDSATDLREKELDQTHELKKMALQTYLEIARAQYLGVNDDRTIE